jgi:uncharacterized lipoprotein YddW (UPF0748 family)
MLAPALLTNLSCSSAKSSISDNIGKTELRGIWIRLPEDTHEIPLILDKIQKSGFNAIFVETLYHGHVIFPGSNFPIRPEYAGKDVLKLVVDEAHQRGIAVHCWTEVFYLQVDTVKYPKFPKSPLFDIHPDWLLLTKKGETSDVAENAHIFADPANPSVQAYLLEFYRDLASRYNIDGINIDYIRYPSGQPDTGYTEFARKTFQNETGADPVNIDPAVDNEMWMKWVKWREDRVTNFVNQLAETIRKQNPKLILSAAIFAKYYKERGKNTIYQDWETWLSNNYLDVIIPMAYAPNPSGIKADVDEVLEKNKGATLVMPALAVPITREDMYGGSGHPPIEEQIKLIRSMKLKGHTVFCYDWILQSIHKFDSFQEVYATKEK